MKNDRLHGKRFAYRIGSVTASITKTRSKVSLGQGELAGARAILVEVVLTARTAAADSVTLAESAEQLAAISGHIAKARTMQT